MTFYNNLFSLTIILLFIRLVFFSIGLPKNFDNLWRPGLFNSLPSVFSWILILVAVVTIIFFIAKLKKTDNKIKNSFFIYFTLSFILLSFLNGTVNETNISYLFLLFTSDSPFSAIYPNLILDWFFDPPYIFWSLIFMAIIYFGCKKINRLEYSIPFWLIPFSFISFHKSDFTTIMLLSFCIVAILGMKYSKRKSSIFILSIQLIINFLSIIYVNTKFNLQPHYLVIASIILLSFYILSFLLLLVIYKNKNPNLNQSADSIALTWILPVTTVYFLFSPLPKLASADNLVYYISILNLFISLGNILLVALFVWLISFIMEKLISKSGKFTFVSLSLIAAIFYILDSTLFYYSQFRINYQTIAWARTMNDVVNTTLKTCIAYLSVGTVAVIVILLISSIILILKSDQIIKKHPNFRFNFLLIILVSQISITLLQLSDPIPQILRDPFFELIKSIPVAEYFKEHQSFDEIEKGFLECKLPLKKYSEEVTDKVNYIENRTNVILITLESVHWRYVNMFGQEPKTWPLMSKLKDRMEIFPLMFSCFPESICGDFAMNSSLVPYSQLYFGKKTDVMHKTIANELKKHGYETLLFASSSLNDSNRISLVKTMPLDYKFSFSSYDNTDVENRLIWGYKEEHTINKILEKIETRNSEKPYFLWYRSVYPHAPYELYDSKDEVVFQERDEYGKLTLLSKYKNSLLHLDRVFYDFISKVIELDRKNNQKTLIVLVGDHGEMLGEKDNGGLTSHGLYTTPLLQNVTCIFIKPEIKGLEVNPNIGSQIDILPTILDYLKLKPLVERYEQGISLYSTNLASRPIYLSSVESYAVVEDGYFFEFHDKNSPNFKITKLSYSNEDYMPKYEYIPNWPSHKEIFEKHQRVKKFFKLQEEFLNQLK